MSANPNALNVDDVTSHVSIFPVPPWQLINKFTSENIAKTTQPPPPPTRATYRMFGSYFNPEDAILRSLESQDVRRVYSQTYNRKRELKKLNFSILANYLDLLDFVTRDPSSPKRPEKLEHLAILFINMHHLINEYRPHQARDLLREILSYQVKVAKETVHKADQYLSRTDELLLNTAHDLPGGVSSQASTGDTTFGTSTTKPTSSGRLRADFSDFRPELAELLNCIQDSAEGFTGEDELISQDEEDDVTTEKSTKKASVTPVLPKIPGIRGDEWSELPIKRPRDEPKQEATVESENEAGSGKEATTDSEKLNSVFAEEESDFNGAPIHNNLDPVLWKFLMRDLASYNP